MNCSYLEVVDAYGSIRQKRMDFLDFARRQEGAVDAVGVGHVDEPLEHDHAVFRRRHMDAAAVLQSAMIAFSVELLVEIDRSLRDAAFRQRGF